MSILYSKTVSGASQSGADENYEQDMIEGVLDLQRAQVQRPAVFMAEEVKPVVIGLAADSGCGKSTFMRRMTGIFGGESKLLDSTPRPLRQTADSPICSPKRLSHPSTRR